MNSIVQACKGTNLHSVVFSSVIECYAQKGLYFDSLFVYRKITPYGYWPKISCLNKLLDVLERAEEFRLVFSLYGSMFRNGILYDMSTWSIIARALCKTGKFERVVRLLELGVSNSVVFGLVIDWYSRIGDFGAAIDQVNEMCRRNLEPGFGIYGCILDGACKIGDLNVIERIIDAMREKKLLPKKLSAEYDTVIKKFCDLGKTYAAELLFKRARGEGVGLEDATFGFMLRACSRGGRANEAIWLYGIILKEKILVKKMYYQELADSLCKEKPSDDAYGLLVDLINRGLSPNASDISMFMMKLGRTAKWKEAEDLLNVMLEAGLLPDSGCCHLLLEHYCGSDQTDSALLLHDKLEKLETLWDVKTYNVLLRALILEKRVDEALRIFDCMRRKNVLSRASFLVMISGLSQEKEMRKAMQLHDEMLKMGLKPSSRTYKNLISVFK